MLRFARRAAFVLAGLALAWLTIAFISFNRAVADRNDRVPDNVRAALAPADGPAIAASHVTLLVGADTSAHRKSRGEDHGRADTLMLMRVDMPSRTVSLLSIPRDLYVEIPGMEGRHKINEAYSTGGLALAVRTVRNVTGVDVNHVARVDFDGFKEIVDELGGVTIDNPTLIESGSQKFDGRHWRFRKGEQTLNGRDALAYARIRYVDDATLERDPAEGTDTGRTRRQQRVIDAIVAEIASARTLGRPRTLPRAMVQPLITDLSATELLTFGAGSWWATSDNNVRCRLGGEEGWDDDGQSQVLIPDEANRAAVRMFMGRQAPQPPENALSAGCVSNATT